jgi:DNA ligase (NAD+)
MNIDGLSEATLERFIDAGYLQIFDDIYRLDKFEAEITQMSGFGKKSWNNLWTAIEASKNTTLARFLRALGLNQVGVTAGKIIGDYFKGDWLAFIQAVNDGFDFQIFEGFGDIINNSIHEYFQNEENNKWWQGLAEILNFEIPTVSDTSLILENPFKGKNVCATGTLTTFTREGIGQKLEELGAKPVSAVSKTTDYLIAGEKAGSKLQKAQTLGIKVLSESEFMEMIGEKD